ncbi:MAG: UdgX family uracil-DNA binding protein, partial [Pseudomonadota bacterium]
TAPAPETIRKVPKSFIDLARTVSCHRNPERFGLLYRVVFRLDAEPLLLRDASDPDLAALAAMEKAVRRDSHKMKAFVRFREIDTVGEGRRRFAAWFEPDHHIVERTAPFFARRFADMDWTIATPGRCAHFVSGHLSFSPGVSKPELPSDAPAGLWRIYFTHIFNPARLKIKAMTAEMPKKYWRNLPETELVPGLVAAARDRTVAMQVREPTAPPTRATRIRRRLDARAVQPDLPTPRSLAEARVAAATCQRCALHCAATETVFGEGPPNASVMLVGEQPGDHEDLTGRPFVGPAGVLLDQILGEVGIDRSKCYVTNAVKHFKFRPRGKRRIHQRPQSEEVEHCRFWLDLERLFIQPKLIVALGSTAALALTGSGNRITKRRGTIETLSSGVPLLVTVHPAYLLRRTNGPVAVEDRAAFQSDLRLILDHVADVAVL